MAHRAAAWPFWPALQPAHFAYIGRKPHGAEVKGGAEGEAEGKPLVVAGASRANAKEKAMAKPKPKAKAKA